jgi:hypothetical protein
MTEEKHDELLKENFIATEFRQDWFLEYFVKLVNESEASLTISLVIGGSIITGELVGVKTYFAGLAREIANATSAELGQVFIDRFSDFAEVSMTNTDNDNSNSDEIVAPTRFIHLRNAKIVQSREGALPDNHGVWWRGKIQAVDGFFIGAINFERGNHF